MEAVCVPSDYEMYTLLLFILLFCNVYFIPNLCLFVWCSSLVYSFPWLALPSVIFYSTDLIHQFLSFMFIVKSFSFSFSSEAWLWWIIRTDNHCHSEHGIQNFVSSWLIRFLLRNWQYFWEICLYIRLGAFAAFNILLGGSIYLFL